MIKLQASPELRQTFETLITTMKVPVKWNGIFVAIDNYLILEGEVRSLFFHFDTRKVTTNIMEIPAQEAVEIGENVHVQNAINMILYAFGKWGTIKGLRVDKGYAQLENLFTNILKEFEVEPEYTLDYMRFYRNGMRVTYEDVIQAALEYQEQDGQDAQEEEGGLWRKIIWEKERANIQQVQTTVRERQKGRLGNNFYMVGYLCPVCGEKMHMVVYPMGKEFRIETEEGAVLCARAFTCSSCRRFCTPRPQKLLAEGDVYHIDFGEDAKAYEDYLELLGHDGDRVSNYRCNVFADSREQMEEEETLEELAKNLPELNSVELQKLQARMEEGFYPDDSIERIEARVQAAQDSLADGQAGTSSGAHDASSEGHDTHGRDHGAHGEDGKRHGGASSEGQDAHGADGKRHGDASSEGHDTHGRDHGSHGEDGFAHGHEHGANGHGHEHGMDMGNGSAMGSADRDSQDASNVHSGYGGASSGAHGANGHGHSAHNAQATGSASEQEETESKFAARMEKLDRYSGRQLHELKGQLERETKLDPDQKRSFLEQVQKRIDGEQAEGLRKKVDACEGKNYAVVKRVYDEVASSSLPEEEKRPLIERLLPWKREQAEREVAQLAAKMPAHMDRAEYRKYAERIHSYEDVDLSPYEDLLKERRMAAEQQEVANLVNRSRKGSHEDVKDLMEKLREGDFLPELVQPYLEKLEERLQKLDEEAIANLLPDLGHVSFEDGMEAYEKIAQGDFLPELKENALEMLSKRLSKIKTDECELLVKKLQDALSKAGLAENPRHHFYPARRVLLGQAGSEETEVIDYALATYASDRGRFEYPILVVDATKNGTGKEGLILTPERLYYSTMLHAYDVPVDSIARVDAATGLLNKGLFVRKRDGEKLKLPYAVETKELPSFARVLDEFVHYLQEKPDSRKVTYLAREKHETICCYRCGFEYHGGAVCPKCGYQNNG